MNAPSDELRDSAGGETETAATRARTDHLLRLTDVHVAYGGLRAVNGVSLAVSKGEALVLLGPNGAGKTSLMNSIAGPVTPASGRIEFRGVSLGRLRTEQRVSRGIVLVPEGRRLFKSLTVADNLRIARASGRSKDFQSALDSVKQTFPVLSERWEQKAGTLSGGEQQMLAIGRALLTEPDLLILDEPSIGLAPKVVHDVYQRLAAVRERGISLLVVEQNMSALDVADRVMVLRNGRVVSEGSPAKYRDVDILADAYLGTD